MTTSITGEPCATRALYKGLRRRGRCNDRRLLPTRWTRHSNRHLKAFRGQRAPV
jgi:hypothetical protein